MLSGRTLKKRIYAHREAVANSIHQLQQWLKAADIFASVLWPIPKVLAELADGDTAYAFECQKIRLWSKVSLYSLCREINLPHRHITGFYHNQEDIPF